ncbi:MAG: zf-HC2 domain-containing protein [Anaerolineae bacterium]|nr:zf-HC2 domain-containing protein [Anaerolineae bacterium]
MKWLQRDKNRAEHKYAEERLSAYLDRELMPEEQAAVERHLAVCEDCRWNLETLRQTVEWTRDCAPVRVPRVFTLPVETAAPQPIRARRPAWGLPLLQGATALVALLFVVVVAGDVFLGSTAPRAEPQMVAVQPTAVMDQAAAVQEVQVTQLAELAVAAPTESAAGMPMPEPAAAKAVPPDVTAVPPSAPSALTVAAPAPTAAAKASGMGAGEPPMISVTLEAMAVAVEAPSGVPKAEATPTVNVTLAFTAATPLLTQSLTMQVMSTAWTTAEHASIRALEATATVEAAFPTATAAPTQDLLPLLTVEPAVETAALELAPVETTDDEAVRDAATVAATEEVYNAAVPTEAPAALLSGAEPTAIAAAPEVREAEQGAVSGEEQGVVGTLRQTVVPWFSLAEIVLGAAFVLLALATAVVMLRWQPR